ncbi:MAG: hypothetical protein IKW30_05310 [Lachnospiraceae bacterium]|nr:hypothetical protein [Lachnospiraceae bacterium]
MEHVDRLLEEPCYVVDFLPKRVSKETNGQFFEVENYLLNHHEWYGLRDRFVRFILKVMCYYPISIYQDGWVGDPTPEQMVEMIDFIMEEHSCDMNIMIKDTLIQFGWDCLHMSVYNPDEEMCELFEQISVSEGLFWRKAD